MRTIYRERIPSIDPRLGRQIHHDSEAFRYEHDTRGLTIASVEHKRVLPILDQRKIGKCTAEAALSILGTEPYWSQALMDTFAAKFGSADDGGTDRFYGAEETLDGNGTFPPVDEGSSGLTSAKVARNAGLISGWTQVFSLDAFLKALTQYPISCGTVWYKSMMDTGPDGVVKVDARSGVAGGHQFECVGYSTATGLLKFDQSWGTRWGVNGTFFMSVAAFGQLLAKRGDATIFTPITQPAPTPTPVPSTPPAGDVALNAELGDWPDGYHLSASAQRVAHGLQTWRTYWGF